jgi:hypothetical protein
LVASAHTAGAAGVVTTCDEAHLDAALAGGGLVTFNCGGAATITVTSTKTISADTTIDGGGLITISGGHSAGVFSVNPSVNFTVQNLIIVNGTGAYRNAFGTGAGAIYNEGTMTVTNSTFYHNSAIGGGGIFNDGTLTVINSTFSDNSAGGGGGIYNSGTLTVTNGTFSGNSGGGIRSFDGALTVTNSTFYHNSATAGGGGIWNYNGTLTVIVTNSTFSDNSAVGGGGGISNGGPLTVTNSTFSGNSTTGGNGGGINAVLGTVTVTNTIVANSVGGNCAGSVTDGGHNIDDGTTCGFTGTGCTTTTGTSFCSTSPVLDPTGLQNNGGPTQTIALQASSPAINAGDESVCTAPPVNNLDQRGYVRPGVGATSCPIGAYEYNAVPAITTLLAADLSATATEVLLTDVSQFPDTGTIRIDGEEMTYNGKQLTSGATAHAETAAAQPGMLLNVQRGMNGTIATSHQAGATVVLIVPACVGDCDGSGDVTVDEILTMVNIALGNTPVTTCEAGDANHDGQITVDEILTAVNNALNGCGG